MIQPAVGTYDRVPDIQYRQEFDQAVRNLREKVLTLDAPVATQRFIALSDDLKARILPIRKQLLETCLDWTDEERALGGWMHSANHRMGNLGRRLATVATKRMADVDESLVQVIARSLQHIGIGVKGELANGRIASRDYRELHALMRLAISLDCAKAKVILTVQGKPISVSIEALYFRALLLARFAHGAITMPQIEILDTWIWQWRAVLQFTQEPAGPEALRADLDTSGGLRVGPRPDGLPALYLPIEPIAEAYRTIVADFHAGRLDREASVAASLPVAEHVAVLDVIRRGLTRGEKGIIARDERQPAAGEVEVFVGIAEIAAKGLGAPRPLAGASLAVELPAPQRERHARLGEVYEQARRMLSLTDHSATGFGLDGTEDDCRTIALGSLVGLRLRSEDSLVICKVMRRLSHGAGRVQLGVVRVTSAAQVLPAVRESADGRKGAEMLVYVPGEEASGSQDGFLIPDALLGQKMRLESQLDNGTYAFRFNRVRRKGRGWSLAGFEIVAMRPSEPSRGAGTA